MTSRRPIENREDCHPATAIIGSSDPSLRERARDGKGQEAGCLFRQLFFLGGGAILGRSRAFTQKNHEMQGSALTIWK
jgi:hypothetical protein